MEKLSAQDSRQATKYIGVLAGAIIAVGLSMYAIMPFAYNVIRPQSESIFAIILYYPVYGMVVIGVAGYFWIMSENKKKIEGKKETDKPST